MPTPSGGTGLPPVATATTTTLDYGGPEELARMLDDIGRILREQDQGNWDHIDLCHASAALSEHLEYRLRSRARRRRAVR